MDEELRKRSTDCVYFLASPLTCKKGIECEYRHSDIARLNPRDCWYWLAGSCLNPTCAFRHPPLDGRVEASSDAALPQNHSSVPVNKTNVPCYFYFNGFCYKGDKCSFLHGPDDNAPAWKSLKTAAAVTDAPMLEKKTFAGSDTGSADSAPIPTLPLSCENAAKKVSKLQIEPKEDLHELFPTNVTERSASTHISASELEEAAAVQLGSLLSAEGLAQNRSLICTDHSSEDQVEGHFEREEWLESSPGFDVLVDDESENLIYNDDPEYLLALDGEQRGLDSHFLGYDYEDHVEYVPAFPDTAIMYEQNIDEDAYNHLDNEHAYDYMRKSPRHSGERKSDPILSSKRKIFPMEMSIDGHRDVDLHHHLKKRRMIGAHPVTRFSRRHNSSQLIGQSMERSHRQHAQQVHGRLALEAENCIIRSINSRDVLMNGAKRRGGFRNSRTNKARQSYKDKEAKNRFLSSEISKKQLSKNKRSIEESAMFTGPKTLAEIKAEKRKARENEIFFEKMGYSSRNRSEDFQGPKPLSEILKDKRRLDSVIDDSS